MNRELKLFFPIAGFEGCEPEMDRGLPSPMIHPPKDYYYWAIAATICCFWPIGGFAIFRANDCRNAIARGDRHLAEQKSAEARKLTIYAVIAGTIACVIVTIINIIKPDRWGE